MAKRKVNKEPLNNGHWHEACDRTHCIQLMVEEMLTNHPAIDQTPECIKIIDKVQGLLWELYQLTGSKIDE